MLTEEEKYRWFSHSFWPIAKGNLDKAYTWDKGEFDWTDKELAAFNDVYECISNQTFDEDGFLDKSLKIIASIEYSDDWLGSIGSIGNGHKITLTESEVAEIIASVCAQCNIYWDDTEVTKFAANHFYDTILGKALIAKDRFISDVASTKKQEPEPEPEVKTSKVAEPDSNVTAQATSGSADNGAKASNTRSWTTVSASSQQRAGAWANSGPRSKDARALVGNPGEKIYINYERVYRIVDNGNRTKYDIRVFVQPFHKDGEIAGTNKVFVGTKRNGGDNTCWFRNKFDAESFMARVQKNYVDANGNPIGTLYIEGRKADKNGYFLVDTQFGKVYIRAKELNEELDDDYENELEKTNVDPLIAMQEANEDLNEFLG